MMPRRAIESMRPASWPVPRAVQEKCRDCFDRVAYSSFTACVCQIQPIYDFAPDLADQFSVSWVDPAVCSRISAQGVDLDKPRKPATRSRQKPRQDLRNFHRREGDS